MPIRLLSQYLQLLAAALFSRGHERGQVGMEIALVGVVCASCVFGAAVIATGDAAGRRLESVLRGGLAQSSGTLVLKGSVIATASGGQAEELVLTLGVIGEIDPVSLGSAATGPRLVVSYRDTAAFDNDVPYTAAEITGDRDGFFGPGETVELRVRLSDIAGAPVLGPSSAWTLELRAPAGGVIEVTRTLPPALDPVNSLR